jgi:putative ABC transport system permease protein
VVISEALATEHHLRIGESFVLPSPTPVAVRVAAVSNNLAWPSGAIVMNSEDYAHAWGTTEASALQIRTVPGASAVAVAQAARRALGHETGLVVETRAEREHRQYASSREGLSRLSQIRLLLLIAAVLAVAAAMASMIWQRRDLVAFIKCEGYSRDVLWRWLCVENALLIAVGSVTGAIFGLYGQLLASRYTAAVTGFPLVYSAQLLTALVSFAIVTLVAVAVVTLPGYLVARTPPRTVSPAY